MRLPRRPNYLGREVAFPLGAVILAGSLVAMPIAVAGGVELGPWPVYLVGVALLGLVDDAFGDPSTRGLRGHGVALATGIVSTGAIKAAGTLALAIYVAPGPLEVGVLVLAAHVGNLLDTGPGRVEKWLALCLVAVCISFSTIEPLGVLAPFLVPVALCAPLTLRERAMLGDCGASLIGGIAGVALVIGVAGGGLYVALALLIMISLYGEFRSISSALRGVPLLHRLDSLGRGN